MATIPEIAVFVFCLLGCGITSWTLGHSAGIVATVNFMIDNNYIEVEDE